jgi:tetratricopeptide (TPR) repeat protein
MKVSFKMSQIMSRKIVFGLSLSVIIAGLLAMAAMRGPDTGNIQSDHALLEPASGESIGSAMPMGQSTAGAYLSSHYAQNKNDWKKATALLNDILAKDPENKELIRQSMVLAAGSGQHDTAAQRATKLITLEPKDGLASLILATEAIAKGDFESSLKTIAGMPQSDMTDFVVPLLESWANAGKGVYKTEKLRGTTIHAWHGGLIALYMKRKPEDIYLFAQTILAPSGLTAEEVERAADLMAVSNNQKDALNIYKALQAQKGGSDELTRKIELTEKKGDIKKLVPAFGIKSPAEGAALAIYDLARILYQEQSDVSARVFAEMALNMDSSLTDATILIASSNARSGQVDEAMAQYSTIPEDHPSYLEVQHASAELLYEAGRMDEAVAHLKTLYEKHKDPDSMIRVGDLYRGKEDYKKALEIYNAVADSLPSPLPKKYWYLLYSRGMAYERLEQWDKAESDLKAALAYQPDHPYILNYLAYGWVDQGKNVEESLKMLLKASSLRPNDGYITDSVGWAYYMNGQYAEAVPHLEDAVQLLPYDPTVNEHLGDSYWRVGRKVEARFQWERAKNYSKDPVLMEKMADKIARGLEPENRTQQAQGSAPAAGDIQMTITP